MEGHETKHGGGSRSRKHINRDGDGTDREARRRNEIA